MQRRVRIVHIITSLGIGGAEMMLLKLLGTMDPARFENIVITFRGGPVVDRLREAGIDVSSLDLRPANAPWAVVQLIASLRRLRPDLVQTWMYHADLFGGIAAAVTRARPIVWNIRASALPPGVKLSTRAVIRLCALLSDRLPRRIVLNSVAAVDHHVAMGYPRDRLEVIPNGVDISLFRPSQADRLSARAELGVAPDVPVIGLVARFDPLKNHGGFIEAAALVSKHLPAARFVMVGLGADLSNSEIREWIAGAAIEDRVLCLGARDDVARLTNAFDVAASTSVTEGFPNAIIEAMACGVPCVVTDVGDSKEIVSGLGRAVPVSDPGAFARACVELLSLTEVDMAKVREECRRRVVEHFSIHNIAGRYESLYDALTISG